MSLNALGMRGIMSQSPSGVGGSISLQHHVTEQQAFLISSMTVTFFF